jgi:peptide-methionine (R)-S-oxide reductase
MRGWTIAIAFIFGVIAIVGIVWISRASVTDSRSIPSPATVSNSSRSIPSSEDKKVAESKPELTPEEALRFHVTRENGTERAFTGKYWNHNGEGIYKCASCGSELFDSKTKYDSGTGWPSFTEPISEERVDTRVDFSLFTQRTEVRCHHCDAHLGHVFEDGPQPSGRRYSINSIALAFDGADTKATSPN